MAEHLINSFTNIVPPFRHDLQIIPINHNGESLIQIYDTLGYSTPDFALPPDAQSIISLIDGRKSVDDIMQFCAPSIKKEEILKYIQFLDEHGLLDSQSFRKRKENIEKQYEQSSTHRSTTAGSSFPKNKNQLDEYLKEAFLQHGHSVPAKNAKALYAPHIDPRVGLSSYVMAFSSIKNLKPKRVVMLATSHYSGLFGNLYEDIPFILVDKNFAMPNGTAKLDKKAMTELKEIANNPDFGISTHSRAHRIEHSLELHVLFMNHIWKHNFEIVPILVNNLEELFYFKGSRKEKQLDAFSDLLYQKYGQDEDTFFLISGDLSHFGKKFGDEKPANDLMKNVIDTDKQFMESALKGDADKMVDALKYTYDATRICGFPPLQTFLRTFPELKGQQLSYDIWDETERESAVSFCSILYQ